MDQPGDISLSADCNCSVLLRIAGVWQLGHHALHQPNCDACGQIHLHSKTQFRTQLCMMQEPKQSLTQLMCNSSQPVYRIRTHALSEQQLMKQAPLAHCLTPSCSKRLVKHSQCHARRRLVHAYWVCVGAQQPVQALTSPAVCWCSPCSRLQQHCLISHIIGTVCCWCCCKCLCWHGYACRLCWPCHLGHWSS
jgi:hypothetical protein